MANEFIHDLIASGIYFQFSASMTEVFDKPRWLYALSNESESRILLHKLELYWDGGETTLLNKREMYLGFFSGQDTILEHISSRKPLYLPDHGDFENPLNDVNFHLVNSYEGVHGLAEAHDPDLESWYPIKMGQTIMKPYVILEPGENLFIGAKAPVESGNLSIIGKGWLYDQEEQPESDPGLKITQ